MKAWSKHLNQNQTSRIIIVMCILGIIHEIILALSRMTLSLSFPLPILVMINEVYSNYVIADVAALIFRLFILFAIIHASLNDKKLVSLVRCLFSVKVFTALVIGLSLYLLILRKDGGMASLENISLFLIKRQEAAICILAAIEFILFIVLIFISRHKMRIIFVLLFIAFLMSGSVNQTAKYPCLITSANLTVLIYVFVGVLYVFSFQIAIGILRNRSK